MIIKAHKIYFLQYEKLLKKQLLTEEQYKEFIGICKTNMRDPRIRPHDIHCMKNKKIISLTIPNTQLRVLSLIVCKPKLSIFVWIGKHREYEAIIKNKRNCKNFIVSCSDADDMECL